MDAPLSSENTGRICTVGTCLGQMQKVGGWRVSRPKKFKDILNPPEPGFVDVAERWICPNNKGHIIYICPFCLSHFFTSGHMSDKKNFYAHIWGLNSRCDGLVTTLGLVNQPKPVEVVPAKRLSRPKRSTSKVGRCFSDGDDEEDDEEYDGRQGGSRRPLSSQGKAQSKRPRQGVTSSRASQILNLTDYNLAPLSRENSSSATSSSNSGTWNPQFGSTPQNLSLATAHRTDGLASTPLESRQSGLQWNFGFSVPNQHLQFQGQHFYQHQQMMMMQNAAMNGLVNINNNSGPYPSYLNTVSFSGGNPAFSHPTDAAVGGCSSSFNVDQRQPLAFLPQAIPFSAAPIPVMQPPHLDNPLMKIMQAPFDLGPLPALSSNLPLNVANAQSQLSPHEQESDLRLRKYRESEILAPEITNAIIPQKVSVSSLLS